MRHNKRKSREQKTKRKIKAEPPRGANKRGKRKEQNIGGLEQNKMKLCLVFFRVLSS